jgi:3-oxoacyl-[acyl-carrier protein] reductase
MKKRVILLSGGSRGLGLGVAEALLQEGVSVATFSRRATADVERLLHNFPDHFRFFEADVADADAFPKLIKNTEAVFGPITGLVNNAGTVNEQLLVRQPVEAIDRLLEVNLRGMLLLTRAVARGMMVRNYGRIVNISSVVSLSGYKGTVAYSATKGGIDAATRALARELGGRNITVNSIAPGYMETELTLAMSEKHLKQIVRRTPLGRPGAIADVVGPVLFMLSDGARFVSGQTLVVDGGLTA